MARAIDPTGNTDPAMQAIENPDGSAVFVRSGRRPLEKSELEIVAGGAVVWMADEC